MHEILKEITIMKNGVTKKFIVPDNTEEVAEIQQELATKANTNHTHTEFYTKEEIDGKLTVASPEGAGAGQLSLAVNGSGNVITDITLSNGVLTVTKGNVEGGVTTPTPSPEPNPGAGGGTSGSVDSDVTKPSPDEGGESTSNGDYKILGVAIDETNPNPETAVTYTDDAVGMIPASQEFMDFFAVKPCVFKNGQVQYYLNPNDYTKKEDGSNADITTGNDGDVMVEIPRLGYNFNRVGDVLSVQLTNNPNNPDFCYLAHSRGDVVKDKLYVGAYLGCESAGKLRSLSGKSVTKNKKIDAFRAIAQANGKGYDQMAFYPLTLLQCMYLIMYKNLDSQTALGKGYVGDNKVNARTGGSNLNGLNYGETTGRVQNKLFGIEDFWGNLNCIIDGVVTSSGYDILTSTENFDEHGQHYQFSVSSGFNSSGSGNLTKVQGVNHAGFIVKNFNDDTTRTSYYCDRAHLNAQSFMVLQGYRNYHNNSGCFSLNIGTNKNAAAFSTGARLMYL